MSNPHASAAATAGASASAADGLSPAMRQYAQQKAQVPDAILLFRMGDFYEMFYDDAKTAARVLGLALTSRSKENPVPLAGIPYHALNGYLARLVAAGYRVAISEQVEDARQAKGVVRREIVRIVTAGTLTEEPLLDARRDNTLAAVCGDPARDAQVGLATIELSSGRFVTRMVPAAALVDELVRIRPAEVLVPESGIDRDAGWTAAVREGLAAAMVVRPADRFEAYRAEQVILAQLGVRTLEGYGYAEFDASLCAAGAVLDYLRETQRSALAHLVSIERQDSSRYVTIDAAALRGLEVERRLRDGSREHTLLWAVDRTVTPMGARRLREWLCYPLADAAAIRARQAAVENLRAGRARLARLRAALREMVDVERVVGRLGVGRAMPRDLDGLGQSLRRFEQVARLLAEPPEQSEAGGEVLAKIAATLRGWSDLGTYLGSALREGATGTVRDGGYIADGFDAELDRLRCIQRNGQGWLAEYQAREASRTGIASLKVAYNQVFGYYIEVTHPHRDKVPPEYVRRQTVRNAERYVTDELKRHEEEVLGAEERARLREAELFEQVCGRVLARLAELREAAAALAALDVLAGWADLAIERNYCRPEALEPGGVEQAVVLEIRDGRHPVLDQTLGPRLVPNDCELGGAGGTLALITGPNMAGKSTYIRQAALLVLLAQAGSFVPARSMRWAVVDRVFARVGSSDELARGQSTFMVEMVETATILNQATRRSLVVLDEIGRGTSTFDGLALAWAICEHLAGVIGCRTLFATHYHELTELEGMLPGLRNLNVLVREHGRGDGREEVVFLHKIVPGATDKSYGVHVARLAGIPAAVVRRSREVLAELERGFSAESHTTRLRPRRAARGALEQLLFPELGAADAGAVGEARDGGESSYRQGSSQES